MYRRGIVSEVDGASHRVRVTFPDRDSVTSGWLDVLVRATHVAKDYDLPALGDQVAVLFDERDEAGCVLGAIYSGVDKPPTTDPLTRALYFGDGGFVEYDPAAHTLRVGLPAGGQIELAGADEPIALADAVRAELDAIKDALDNHTHAAGLLASPAGAVTGMTGSAAPPGAGYSPGDVGSAQVKSA